jgi:nitrogen-specific signal transduction histidine kinase
MLHVLSSGTMIVAVLVALIGGFAFFKGEESSKKWFFAFTLALSGWIVSTILETTYPEAAPVWLMADFSLAILSSTLFYFFASFFVRGGLSRGSIIFHVSLLIIGIVLVTSNRVVSSFEFVGPEIKLHEGPAFILYTLFLAWNVLAGLSVFVSGFRIVSAAKKRQLKIISISLAVSALFAILTNLILPALLKDVGVYRLGIIGFLFFVLMTAYAMVRYQLFDIRVVIKRIFLYTLLLGFVFGVYSVVIQALSGWLPLSRNVANFVAALVLAFSFDPVRRVIARWTEQYLFVSEYKANDVIKELSDKLAGVVDLDEALRLVVKIVTSSMRVDRGAAVVVRPGDDGERQLHVGANVAVPAPTRLIEEGMMPLVEYLELVPEAILTGQLAQVVENDELTPSAIRRFVFRNGKTPNHHLVRLRRQSLDQLNKLKLGASVPVVVNKKLICVLLLGEKLSDDIFFTEDVKFLQLVASTMANAIEKARFYEEDQIKSEFVSIASHELLTPTAAIEGYLSMILVEKMGKVDKQAEQYLQVVYKSAQRLAVLVKDLLAMSRIEGNRIQIAPKYFDLGTLVKEQVMTILPRATEKDLKLVLKAIPKGELKSYADPEKVTQIFINLVGNAIKYTKKGSVTVTVADHNTHWEISVTDTGIGMTPTDRQHLFEKFYRIQNDSTMGITGTGLGLYISKSLITMMGGDITVESTPGQGSTFAFTVAKKPNHAT